MRKFNFLTLVFLLMSFLGFSQELVTNGNFESGVTGWSGNAANVVTENGNSYNAANIAVAGNAWDVNLSQVLALTAGKVYTLTFDAWSDRDRTLVAGIGLNENPWSAATAVINLTSTSKRYTLTLTAPASSANSRVIFDMGAAVGFVGIDNVSLVEAVVVPPSAQPLVAAPTPTLPESSVKSVFSDAYTNLSVNEWGPFWGDASSRINEISIENNPTKVMDVKSGQVFAGIDFSSSLFDATSFTNFYLDYWVADPIPAGLVFNVKLSNHNGGAGETSAVQYTVTPESNKWVRLDIPLDSFVSTDASGKLDRNAIAQIVITAARANSGEPVAIYLDNILFYNKNLSTNEVSVSNVVKLYPNPVSQGESVYVDTEFEKIEVFTLSGQLAKTLEKGKSFSTNGLIKGVYLVKLTAKNGVIKTSKLMVK
ncbi:carbohydrate binding domain-containing protein [Riemerella anatipestifer]|uniref:carbohydrate binding domain-containing protein n=1 Tax=Riemerella anatipestifer TaxID=34085 RepID=UPI0007ECF97D|nr:carbohydrate binding domain-containing protein [Riemerella anatipestifer]MDD1548430.1 T9SS type A sorting domain-containing protein [Riemerella anatipestifer]MDR7831015.1 carbohydrate binding domain-containing protein [Riemerella anatipestifer]MDY3345369.1 carbohydrate binding domain-containing protein [Riemerella anatipestifer]MDY3358449.1 carbohydrate binding domain-containing protein [Riemerella anatipestifer]OBP63463.1 hypothetical protein AWB84_04665 [Riemerella anatipestifer]